MQSLSWYGNRLRAMSAPEICWRIHARLRDMCERYAAPRWFAAQPLDILARSRSADLESCGAEEAFQPVGDVLAAAGEAPWARVLRQRAAGLCDNRMTLFNLQDLWLGPTVLWNHDYDSGQPAPLHFAPTIDYRDHSVTGDAKFVWEHNRHQHLVVLARAWQLTGERRFAEKLVQDLSSWLEQCPCGYGMNWRSPLELAIRLINWTWAIEMIKPAGVMDRALGERVLGSVYQHLREVTRKYSRYSSANNHLIGEAAGVFIASTYFNMFRECPEWSRESRQILLDEIHNQVLADGGHVELSPAYHLFVLEFFTLAAVRGGHVGLTFPSEYWSRLEDMYAHVVALCEGGPLPQFNDADDGIVLDVGPLPQRVANWMAVGAALFRRPDFDIPGGTAEGVTWLCPSQDRPARPATAATVELRSRALADSGYYLLQHGHVHSPDAISVAFDCGALGMGTIAAHGHADALSFTLRAFGVDVFVDPGTYDYFTAPDWRTYFRSTRAHNTVEIDGLDQSQMLGPFLWGRRATARCLSWKPTAVGGSVCGEHDGYVHTAGVVHRRTLSLDGTAARLEVNDVLTGSGTHDAALHMHLAEHCVVEPQGSGRWLIDCGPGLLRLTFDPRLDVQGLFGSTQPIAGWVSRGYHHRTPAVSWVARRTWQGRAEFNTSIEILGDRSSFHRTRGNT